MKDDNAIVVFQDEVHFQQQTSVTRMWYKKGSEPKVDSAPGKKSIAYSGYVVQNTGELIMTKPGWFTYETVIDSLREFIEKYKIDDGKKLHLVLDGAPWHRKAIRLIQDEKLPEYADIREKIILEKLPPYSPDLNPIEQVWRITRREVTHNHYFSELSDLESRLDGFFCKYRAPNDKFYGLCNFEYSSC